MVRTSGTGNLLFRDLSGTDASAVKLEEVMQETFLAPLELVQGPLHLVEMIRMSDQHHLLAFSIHHAIADGWSLGVFVQDLCTAWVLSLRGRPSSPHGGMAAVPQTYAEWGAADRAFWQAADLTARISFWKAHLAGSRPVFIPPGEDAAPEPGPLHRCISVVPAQLTQQVREFAKSAGTTLFSTLLSAFQFTLSRWSGSPDILTGSPVANRHRETCWQTMGYCAGVVPIRSVVDPELTFSARARNVHTTAIDCFANAMPFAELAAAVGPVPPGNRHTLFDVRFALQNHPVPDVNLPGISTQLRMRSTGTARFDLGCEITEEGAGLEVVWLYRPHLLNAKGPSELHTLFIDVLSYACSRPDSSCSSFTPTVS